MNIKIESGPRKEFFVFEKGNLGENLSWMRFRVRPNDVVVNMTSVERSHAGKGLGKKMHLLMGKAVGPGMEVRSDNVVNYETKKQLSCLGIAERFVRGSTREQLIDDPEILGQLLIARVYLGAGFDNLVLRMKKEEVSTEHIFYPEDYIPDPWILNYKLSLTARTTDVHGIPQLDDYSGACRVFRYIKMYPNGE